MTWPRRRNKFNARACVVDGIRFDSHRERVRYGLLKALEASGRLGLTRWALTRKMVRLGINSESYLQTSSQRKEKI